MEPAPATAPLPEALVVDDELLNLQTFRRVFRSHFSITTVQTGREAVALLEQRPFRVVFADYAMPEMVGTEVLTHASRLQPNARRVLVTAYADLAEVIEAQRAGIVEAVVRKPWTTEELLAWAR